MCAFTSQKIPKKFIDMYNLLDFVTPDGWVFFKIRKGVTKSSKLYMSIIFLVFLRCECAHTQDPL